jgi:hypothetical protein
MITETDAVRNGKRRYPNVARAITAHHFGLWADSKVIHLIS